MRINYVLIDYENLQPDVLSSLDLEHFRVMVFLGANQTKIPVELAASLQRLGSRAQYVRISGNGRNALDFHIAFYMGEVLASDPTAVFHIIAADAGYDPLLQHLKDRKVFARRHTSAMDIPHVKASNVNDPSSRLQFVKEMLDGMSAGKPAVIKTLHSRIRSFFPSGMSDTEISQLVSALSSDGYLTINGTKVKYHAT